MEYNKIIRHRDNRTQVILAYKDDGGVWKQRARTISQNDERLIEDTFYDLRREVENIAQGLQPVKSQKTFTQFGNDFVGVMEIRKEFTTSRSYQVVVNRFTPFFGDKLLSDIVKTDVQLAVDKLNHLNKSTLKAYLTLLRRIFRSAIEDEKALFENPAAGIEYKGTESARARRALTKPQLDTLLDSVDDLKHKTYLSIAGTCGLRGSEILGLTWNAIDWENAEIKVLRQWKLISSEKYGFGKLKSVNSYRAVPVPSRTLEILERYQKRTSGSGDMRLFDYGCVASVDSTMTYIFNRLNTELTVHELRHTYATLLIFNGVDPKSAAALLGHSVEEFLRIYSHYTSEMAAKTKVTIEDIFN